MCLNTVIILANDHVIMRKVLISVLLCMLVWSSIAQQVSSPGKIYKILEASHIMYELREMKERVKLFDRSHLINGNAYYRSHGIVMEYPSDYTTEKWFSLGEADMVNGNTEAARNKFQRAMKRNPEFHLAVNRIAMTYYAEGDIDNALEWFQRAVEYNPIDSEAWTYLAGIYFNEDKQDEALDAITRALILNRNHPDIQQEFNAIFDQNYLDGSGWIFNPQFRIDSISERMIHVYYDLKWMGYAMAKAAWWYEPGYADSKGKPDLDRRLLEERECLSMLHAMLNKDKIRNNPEFYSLHLAFQREMLSEYIFFEILLPDYPELGLHIRPEFIESVQRYLLEIRGGLEPQN